MPIRLRLIAAVAGAMLACATLSQAQQAGSGDLVVARDERYALGLQHHDRGKALFDSGDFVAAAVEFGQAHEFFAPISRNPDGSVLDAQARSWDRAALTNEATAYSRAELPVEAREAFLALRTSFASELDEQRKAEIDAAVDRLSDRIGLLQLIGLPRDVQEVRIDGRLVPRSSWQGPFAVAAGRHAVEITGESYKPFAKALTVVGRSPQTLEVRLEKSDRRASLRVETSAEPAMVQVDGKPAGNAPLEVFLSPGKHKLSVTSEGFRTNDSELTVEPGQRALVRVGLIPNRTPIGLRIEPAVGATIGLRGDTPFNNWVDEGESLDEGYPYGMHAGLRLFHSLLRFRSLATGLTFDYHARPLNKVQMGPIVDWCPDALTWAERSRGWCPVSTAVLMNVVGGEKYQFSGGEYSLRLGTKLEARFGGYYFHFGGGLSAESYKRNAIQQLTLGTAYFAVGMGMDL